MIIIYDLQFFQSDIQPIGRVKDDKRYEDGSLIRTSDIISYNKEDSIFKTINGSEYKVESFFDGLSKTKMEKFSEQN